MNEDNKNTYITPNPKINTNANDNVSNKQINLISK